MGNPAAGDNSYNDDGNGDDADIYIMTKCLFVILLQVIRATMIREDDGDNGDDDDADNNETGRTEEKNVFKMIMSVMRR